MKKEILINSTEYETRVAILEDHMLVELRVERPETERMVGDIYKGIIKTVLPGMQAAFVDIGLPRAAYLHSSDIGKDYSHNYDSEDLEEEEPPADIVRKKRRAGIETVLKGGQEMAGIVSYGGYVPRYRLNRMAVFQAMGWFNPANLLYARGEKAVANYDEDGITMATAAARWCAGSSSRTTTASRFASPGFTRARQCRTDSARVGVLCRPSSSGSLFATWTSTMPLSGPSSVGKTSSSPAERTSSRSGTT